jgi:protein-S-isoprenylcysteine O-methyltransferase Ste14
VSWADLRRRGVGWVIAQFVVIAGIVAGWFVPPDCPDELTVPGSAIAAAGVALGVWSAAALGRITPLPEPRDDARLVTHGPYSLARHPLYGGLLLVFGGLSLVWSVPSLVVTAMLAVLWWRKSLTEERRLSARYPEYESYRRRTRRRFVPFVA